jgi:hypothetical protein
VSVGQYQSPHGIEQSRRDFKADHPELYEYIRLREQAKAYKTCGDTISGAVDGHGAANRVWVLMARAEAMWRAML